MSIRSFFRKIKIKAKTFIFILGLTILEVILLISGNDGVFELYHLIPLIQLGLIFERRDQWSKLSEKEKEKVLISDNDLLGLVLGIEKLVKEGDSADIIVEKIKKED